MKLALPVIAVSDLVGAGAAASTAAGSFFFGHASTKPLAAMNTASTRRMSVARPRRRLLVDLGEDLVGDVLDVRFLAGASQLA